MMFELFVKLVMTLKMFVKYVMIFKMCVNYVMVYVVLSCSTKVGIFSKQMKTHEFGFLACAFFVFELFGPAPALTSTHRVPAITSSPSYNIERPTWHGALACDQ